MIDSCLFDLDSSPEAFPTAVMRLLFERDNWPQCLADWLKAVRPEQLLKFAHANPEPPNVQPRSICIADTRATTVVLNWFDAAEYARSAKLGRQAPHRHQFDFGTRVLKGGYVQWLFANQGDLQAPQLRFGRQMSCHAGDGYHLAHDAFHHVFAPEDDTITLMVRSPVRRAVQRTGRALAAEELLADRDKLARALAALPTLPRRRPSDARLG